MNVIDKPYQIFNEVSPFGIPIAPKSLKDKKDKKLFQKPKFILTKCALLNRGMVMGDEDALSSAHYSKTARCKSLKAEVWAIKAVDFLALVKACRRAHATICKRELAKLDKQMNQVHLLKRVASAGAEHQGAARPKKQYLMKASEFFFNRDNSKEVLHIEPAEVKASPAK